METEVLRDYFEQVVPEYFDPNVSQVDVDSMVEDAAADFGIQNPELYDSPVFEGWDVAIQVAREYEDSQIGY